jgi:hypothetical protein
MREITLRIPDEQFGFFRKLLQNLPWVQVEKTRKLPAAPAPPFTAEQQEFVDELKQSLREAEAWQRGELQLPTMEEHIAEIRAARAAEGR